MSNTPAFNTELIEERLKDLKTVQFKPDVYEPRYIVTQLFRGGKQVKLAFVIRDGEMIFYDSFEEENIFNPEIQTS